MLLLLFFIGTVLCSLAASLCNVIVLMYSMHSIIVCSCYTVVSCVLYCCSNALFYCFVVLHCCRLLSCHARKLLDAFNEDPEQQELKQKVEQNPNVAHHLVIVKSVILVGKLTLRIEILTSWYTIHIYSVTSLFSLSHWISEGIGSNTTVIIDIIYLWWWILGWLLVHSSSYAATHSNIHLSRSHFFLPSNNSSTLCPILSLVYSLHQPVCSISIPFILGGDTASILTHTCQQKYLWKIKSCHLQSDCLFSCSPDI